MTVLAVVFALLNIASFFVGVTYRKKIAEKEFGSAEEKAKAAEAEAEAEIQAKAQREQDAARMEELVEIKLFKDNGKYKDDVFVSVNGETIAIKRGERVKIKRKFAEVLENSDHQDQETARLIEEKSSEGRKAWAEMDK